MKIAIPDIPVADLLDRQALMTIRGGASLLNVVPAPWLAGFPQFPAFPIGFPFTDSNPVKQPAPGIQVIDPQNPLLQ